MSFPVAAAWTNGDGLTEGNTFLIQGFVHPDTKRFAVNFLCANGDIAFHLNPRFDKIVPVVVCNTQMKSKKWPWIDWRSDEAFWKKEKIAPSTPFKQSAFFEMTIDIENDCYQVYVNGNHFLEYKHRVPYETIQTLEIKGDISVKHFEFFETKAPPTSSPPDSCDMTHDKVYVKESHFLEKPCLSSKIIQTFEIKSEVSVKCSESSETKPE